MKNEQGTVKKESFSIVNCQLSINEGGSIPRQTAVDCPWRPVRGRGGITVEKEIFDMMKEKQEQKTK